jgi:hypothetical protein
MSASVVVVDVCLFYSNEFARPGPALDFSKPVGSSQGFQQFHSESLGVSEFPLEIEYASKELVPKEVSRISHGMYATTSTHKFRIQ